MTGTDELEASGLEVNIDNEDDYDDGDAAYDAWKDSRLEKRAAQ